MSNYKTKRSKLDWLSIGLYQIGLGAFGYFPKAYWRDLRAWEAAHSPAEVEASRKAWEDYCYNMVGIF